MQRFETSSSPVPVLLTHGIWMTSLELRWLGNRLSQCGFTPRYFQYNSLGSSPDYNARRLEAHIREMNVEHLHLVAHSLGGVVLLHLFDQFDDLPPGRVVLLGTPVAGSGVARVIGGYPWLKPLLGQSLNRGLLGDIPPWQDEQDLGVIAGTRQLGVGTVIGGVKGESDGTVAVAETRLEGAKASCTVRASHMGMLFSRDVARQTCCFLREGRFVEA